MWFFIKTFSYSVMYFFLVGLLVSSSGYLISGELDMVLLTMQDRAVLLIFTAVGAFLFSLWYCKTDRDETEDREMYIPMYILLKLVLSLIGVSLLLKFLHGDSLTYYINAVIFFYFARKYLQYRSDKDKNIKEEYNA